MSGIQFSSPVTNQKASPAVYASSLATRPSPKLPGRIFVDTDNPSTGMYRDTGTAWVQISSGGGGGTPDLQTVCNVGFLTDTDMTFLYENSLSTSTIGFFNQDVGNFGFDIFKKANELFSIRALKPSGVDEEMELIFDAPANVIKTKYNDQNKGIYLDFFYGEYLFGDIASTNAGLIEIIGYNINLTTVNNSLRLFLDDSNEQITTKYGGNEIGLQLDFANRNFYFGNDWQEATNLFGWFGMTANAGSQQWNIRIKDTVDFNSTFTQYINSEEGFNQLINAGTQASSFSQNAAQFYNAVQSTAYNSYVQILNESFYVSINNNSTSVTTFFNLDGANQRLEVSNNLKSATAGGNSGQHLKIRVGGTDYKITLLNP